MKKRNSEFSLFIGVINHKENILKQLLNSPTQTLLKIESIL